MSKKRVGLSMVRNESDVIETFIRHNLTLLDELHIVDHNSSDNTREILTLLKQEGLPIHIYHYNELEYAQERIMNQMMQYILNNDANIDYIFPLDADEFIYCPSREKLNAFLTLIPQDRVGMYTWRGYLPHSTEYKIKRAKKFKVSYLLVQITNNSIIGSLIDSMQNSLKRIIYGWDTTLFAQQFSRLKKSWKNLSRW